MRKVLKKKYKEFANGFASIPFNRQLMALDKAFNMDDLISNSKAYRFSTEVSIYRCTPKLDDIILWDGNSMAMRQTYDRTKDGLQTKFLLAEPSVAYPDGRYAYWSIGSKNQFLIYDENNILLAEYVPDVAHYDEFDVLYVKDTTDMLYVVHVSGVDLRIFRLNKATLEIQYQNTKIGVGIVDVSMLGSNFLTDGTLCININIMNVAISTYSDSSYFFIDIDDFANKSPYSTIRAPGAVGLANLSEYSDITICVTDCQPYLEENEFVYRLQFYVSDINKGSLYSFMVCKYDLIQRTHTLTEIPLDLGAMTQDEFTNIISEIVIDGGEIISFTTPAPYDPNWENEIVHLVTKSVDSDTSEAYLRFMQFRYKIDPSDPINIAIKLYGTQRIACGNQNSSGRYWKPIFLNNDNTHLLRKENWGGSSNTDTIEMRFDHWNGWYNLNRHRIGDQVAIDFKTKQLYDYRQSGNIYSFDTLNAASKFIHIKGFDEIDYTGTDATYDLEISAGYLNNMVESIVTLQIVSSNAVFENGTPEGTSAVELEVSADSNNPTIVQIRIIDYGNIQIDGSALSYDEYLYLKNSSLM